MVCYLEIFAFSTLTKMLGMPLFANFPLKKLPSFGWTEKKNTHGCSHASNRSAVSSRWFITSAWELHHVYYGAYSIMIRILTLCWSDFENVTNKNIQICKVTKNPEDLKVSLSQCFKRFHFAHGPWAKWSFSAASWLRSLSCCACWLLVAWKVQAKQLGRTGVVGVKQIKQT